MDLTKLTHYLIVGDVEHIIDEPVGFDNLKTTIKRGDYHGISAEVSVGSLEFYNSTEHDAADIIRNAYNTDIDTEIVYKVMCDEEEVYSGVVDLSTYSESTGNCTKISCSVGEIGVKTTFNNRSETEIDLNRETTMDGVAIKDNAAIMAYIGTKFNKILIPKKTIMYTNALEAKENVVWDADSTNRFNLADDKSHQWINLPPSGTPTFEEFGEVQCMADIAQDILADDPRVMDALIGDYYQAFFAKGSGWDEKYGSTSKYNIEYDIQVRIEALDTLFTNSPSGGVKEYTTRLCLVDGTMKMGDPINGTFIAATEEQTFTNNSRARTFRLQGTLTNQDKYKLLIGLSMRNRNFYDDGIAIHHYYNDPCPMRATITKGSYIRMYLASSGSTQNVYAQMFPVHEALNKIVECISENQLICKSHYYGRHDSVVPNSTEHQTSWSYDGSSYCGGGALKAITNGYKIRNLYTDEENERNMPMSFKDMIEALDTLDCVGWGFVEEEDGLCVRVEKWDWFYKNNVVLSITDPNSATRKVETDKMITALTIGFKKYTTNEDINAIDSIHSERTFTSTIKAISKDVSKLCKWIADNYSIEETRKKSIEATTDEFKYDENIFVFELCCDMFPNGMSQYSVARNYGVYINVLDIENINYPEELYNARLSPRRMAERWKTRVALFNTTAPLELTSGKVNYKAKYKCTNVIDATYHKYLFHDTPTSAQIAEDESIANTTPIMKAETYKFKYPLTISQYQSIKRDPYGLIVVDGQQYWLKEMTFTFKSGEAELTLIPKA